MITTEEYRVGYEIIRQGDTDKSFYILEKGAVEVIKDGILLNVLMFPGTIFGEISGILGKPRTSTIRVRTPTKVTKYEGLDFPQIVREHPDLATRMLETLASRLERTTQKLTDSL